jgi:polyisoprenoid-binding protein YceI
MVLFAGEACVRANGPESRQNSISETSPPAPASGVYKLDPAHSFVSFAAQHMVVGRVRGRFNEMSGTLVAGRDPQASTVDVRIDAGSVDTQNHLRDAELRGPDFFDAPAFPTIEYHARGLRRVGEKWVVDGTLTIREIARAVPLELLYKGTAPPRPGEPRRIAFYATAAVKRADFGMTRGLLDEIGVVSKKPDVWIEIDAEFLAEGSSETEGGVDG